MLKAVEFYRRTKIEELAARLRSEGYVVEHDSGPFDLSARKGQHGVAYEVKVVGGGAGERRSPAKLRELARQRGLEFLVQFVPAPQLPEVQVANLDETLLGYLQRNPPEDVRKLVAGGKVRVTEVIDPEVRKAEVSPGEIRVEGEAFAVVDEPDGERAGPLPLSFDLVLGADLKILRVVSIDVDTSPLEYGASA